MQSGQFSDRTKGWVLTTGIVALVLLAGVAIRIRRAPDGALRRTRSLVAQKESSLHAYNSDRPIAEILDFYEKQTGHPVTAGAFDALTESIVEQVIPTLWRISQDRQSSGRWILHHAMYESIQESYPHQTLTNADVIVFPHHPELRIVVSEPNTDFFRDSGWHWRWIGKYLECQASTWWATPKELDVYAAEELSEFLSVLGVAVVEMAAANATTRNGTIDAEQIRRMFQHIHTADMRAPQTHHLDLAFSEETKTRLLNSVPNPMFREVTDSVKLKYRHLPNPDHWNRRTLLNTPIGLAGGGVSATDYDDDGNTDLYFGGDLGGALFRNIGGNEFRNVSKSAGIQRSGESRAGYFVDFDNDGDQDLYITYVGLTNRLYENTGQGTFQDVTEAVQLFSGTDITHEAVWFDLNNDGYLDVYTANYGDWLVGDSPTIGRTNDNAPPNRLYLHRVRDGRHVFEEVSEKMHVADRGWTHCVGAFDFDRDGWMDLFSLNDFGASLVFRNVNGKDFEEVSGDQKMDDVYNAMNFTLLDLDHTGMPSIYISQMMKLIHRQRYSRPTEETPIVFDPTKKDNLRVLNRNRLFSRTENNTFVDEHNQRIEPAYLGWGWDVSGLDYENDADLDLIVLNGTETNVPSADLTRALQDDSSKRDAVEMNFQGGRNFLSAYNNEQNVCFLQEDSFFYDVSSINPIAFRGNSRGSAFLDFDQDGDLDVAVSNYDAPVRFFENVQTADNCWVRFQLEGTRSNRNAVGARVEIQFDDQSRYDQVVSGSGFLSQNPYRLHFGIGKATRIDKVIIHWPAGSIQQLSDLVVNTTHHIKEPLP